MPNLVVEGEFEALVKRRVVATSKNGLVQVGLDFHVVKDITGRRAGVADVDMADTLTMISEFFSLEVSDGGINEFARNSLMDSMGWDGISLEDLQDSPIFNDCRVQIVCAMDEYEGKKKMRVKYLNKLGSSGGAKSATKDELKKHESKIGAKLRALGANPAARKAGSVSSGGDVAGSAPSQRQASAGAPSQRPQASKTNTKEDAYNKLKAECEKMWKDKCTQELIDGEWWQILDKLFPGKEMDALSGGDWSLFVDKCGSMIVPF